MRQYLLVVVFLFTVSLLKAQDSALAWLSGNIHESRVLYFQGLFQSDGVIRGEEITNLVRDTFSFRNLTEDTLVLENYVYKFSYSQVVAPGETGYILYEAKIPVLNAESLQFISDSAEFKSNSGFKLKVKIELIVIYHNLKSKSAHADFRDSLIFTDAAGREKVLAFYQEGRPKYLGQRLITGRVKVGTWRYWNQGGKRIRDSVFTKELLVPVVGGSKFKNLRVLVYQNHEWKAALYTYSESKYHESKYSVYLKPGEDSLYITNDSVSMKIPVSYSKMGEALTTDPLYLLSPGQLYIQMQGHKKPVYFVEREYALFIKRMKDEELPKYFEDMQRRFPELKFAFRKNRDLVWHVDFREARNHPDTFYLRMLKQEQNVLYIGQLCNDGGFKRVYVCDVIVRMEQGCKKDSLLSILKHHPFSYNRSELTDNQYVIHYTSDKLLDEAFFRALMRLEEEACIKWLHMERLNVGYNE